MNADKQTTASRKEFEAWIKTTLIPGCAEETLVEYAAWAAWQAARLSAPAEGAAAVQLTQRITELTEQHGTLRAAARVLKVDPGYLSRIGSGEKKNVGETLLRRMGLREITTYERTK